MEKNLETADWDLLAVLIGTVRVKGYGEVYGAQNMNRNTCYIFIKM